MLGVLRTHASNYMLNIMLEEVAHATDFINKRIEHYLRNLGE